jgi:glycine cleavage system H protein
VVVDQPELVNSEPYQGGWLVELIDVDEAGVEFLSAEAYQSLVE